MYPQVSEDIECTSPITSLKFSSDLQFLNLSGEPWQPHVACSCYNEEQITSALDCQDQTDGEQGNRQVEGGGGEQQQENRFTGPTAFPRKTVLPDARETHQTYQQCFSCHQLTAGVRDILISEGKQDWSQ